ncbi:hypothetical protein Tco_1574105, partial [Tanacetum coccineum]
DPTFLLCSRDLRQQVQVLLEHLPPWLWILGDHLEFSLGRLRFIESCSEQVKPIEELLKKG